MAGMLSDSEKLAYLVELVADEIALEAHLRTKGLGDSDARAAALAKLRKFLQEDVDAFLARKQSPTTP